MLAEQKLGARDRRDIQVHDGAQLFFAHHGQCGEHGGQHQQQKRHHGRHHGRQALDVGVVAEAGFHLDLAGELHAQAFLRLLRQPVLVHALHIALDGFCACGHGAINPCADVDVAPAQHVAPEPGRNLERQRQLAAAHAPVEVGVVGDGGVLGKVARSAQALHIVLADGALVAVKHGKAQAVHVHADAETDHHHQHQRADQRQRGAHRVALQLQRFAPEIAVQALQAECLGLVYWGQLFCRCGLGRCWCRCRCRCRCLANNTVQFGRWLAGGFHQIADESFFQCLCPALGHQRGGCVAVQHPAGVHHRHTVAALGLVHEVGGDEDRHMVAARQFHQQTPELVARHRVHARGGLVQNQQLGLVHHGHGQRQALAFAQRQLRGQAVALGSQAEAFQHFGGARANFRWGHMEQACMQLQVLQHR
ncbi:hypothetical protein SDC9_102499 [bioreactor metagenome]|uniref:Uncharacterized protein n=1 Tax=bioreactor metagenome TaxID=1076179 RepID=A0A645AR11_9ZZZZ